MAKPDEELIEMVDIIVHAVRSEPKHLDEVDALLADLDDFWKAVKESEADLSDPRD